jgi:hypothetical protein
VSRRRVVNLARRGDYAKLCEALNQFLPSVNCLGHTAWWNHQNQSANECQQDCVYLFRFVRCKTSGDYISIVSDKLLLAPYRGCYSSGYVGLKSHSGGKLSCLDNRYMIGWLLSAESIKGE